MIARQASLVSRPLAIPTIKSQPPRRLTTVCPQARKSSNSATTKKSKDKSESNIVGKTKLIDLMFADSYVKERKFLKKDMEALIQIVFDVIRSEMVSGSRIQIQGFGSFEKKQRSARKGRNPKSGDVIEIPAKDVPRFSPSQKLKDELN